MHCDKKLKKGLPELKKAHRTHRIHRKPKEEPGALCRARRVGAPPPFEKGSPTPP